jgi:trimeric autotransporter adhesin
VDVHGSYTEVNLTAITVNGVTAFANNGTFDALNVPLVGLGSVATSAGGSHSLALRSDCTVVAWGNNTDGQATVPAGLNGIAAVSAGGGHSLALKTNGTG